MDNYRHVISIIMVWTKYGWPPSSWKRCV